MTDNTQPEALDLADWLEAVGGGPSAKRCAALLREQHARIAELEAQLEAIGAASAGSEPVAWVDERALAWLANSRSLSATITTKLEKGKSFERPMPIYLHPSPPEGAGWRPIATAPEGQMVVVGWLDLEDTEHPERHDFDLLEDGCWQKWHDHAEHVEVIGGHGVSYTPPYTVWMPVGQIPAPPASEAKEL